MGHLEYWWVVLHGFYPEDKRRRREHHHRRISKPVLSPSSPACSSGMANLEASPATPILSKRHSNGPPLTTQFRPPKLRSHSGRRASLVCNRCRRMRRVLCCRSAPAGELDLAAKSGVGQGQDGYLVKEFGWGVRRMVEMGDEMKRVAQVQAEAFHVPMALFNDLFFEFFKAEVLSALIYKIRNSPSDRYACLVAESVNVDSSSQASVQGLVGVVDVTVQRDEDVIRHLKGAEEYLYVSGIAVLTKFRRQKIATALLKACDVLSVLWGFRYLALRAYEDDSAARRLYSNAGYKVVSGDPYWITWIGRKRRVLMIKPSVISRTPYGLS